MFKKSFFLLIKEFKTKLFEKYIHMWYNIYLILHMYYV